MLQHQYMYRLLAFLFVFSIASPAINAQNAMSKRNQIEALNSVLNFTNESDHGLLIVHRMLENYNQDINKYVDLESFKINFYTNKDLPKDIFDDPENWFYDNSPYEWHGIASSQLKATNIPGASAMIADMTQMKSILTEVNKLRFDLDNAIINKDLTDTVQLNRVYAELERGVRLYDSFYDLHQGLLSKVSAAFKPLQPTAADVQHPKLYKTMVDLYLSTRSILTSVRTKEDEQMDQQIANQRAAIATFKALDFTSFGSSRLSTRKVQRIRKNMEEQADLSLASAKKFFETAEVSEEYKQYGKFYYYYNSELINKYNRYGNGIVFELNNMIKYLDIPVLLFTEMPHYFKVIYPKKLEKTTYYAATDPNITRLPEQLRYRDITTSKRTIKVDNLKFKVSLYDHFIEDGDVVSINFNGDWIIDEMPLLDKKKDLYLQLNEEGKNFFILHAINVGSRPPNTMAVDYSYRGFKKQIILESDLNVSELIEIEYVPSN